MATRLRKWKLGVTLGIPSSSGLGDALQWLMLARLGVLYVLLAVVVLQQVFRGDSLSGFPLRLAYGLLSASFAFNLIQAFFVERIADRRFVPASHVIFDAVVTSLWIYFCAEKESLFALLYLIQILVVSLVLYQKGALLASMTTTLCFGLVMIVHPMPNGLLIWGTYAMLFTVLGVVGGYLSEELRRTTESLKDKSRKIEKLMALHERIIADIPTGLLTVDSDMRINFINPAAAQILGCQSGNPVGTELAKTAPGLLPFFAQIEADPVQDEDEVADAQPPTGIETAVSATGDVHHRSFFVRAKSDKGQARLQQRVELGTGAHRRTLRGDVADLEVDGGLSKLLGDHATGGRVLLFQDVTKLLHLEEKLKQNEKLAAVGQLAAGIAHEIRNPLASMSASIEMLKTSLPPESYNSENQKLMDIAIREIDRLNRLITEFLGFVKPEKLRFDRVELGKLLSEIVLSVRQSKELNRLKETRGKASAQSAELRDKIAIVENFAPETFALANAEKLKQVIWNLLVNAVQSMSRPGKIEVGCAALGPQRVKFWVTDDGMGMSEETLAHLYEPFFTTKERGTGLGLATAYKIVEAHHGEIRVQSQLQSGTRFEVILQGA